MKIELNENVINNTIHCDHDFICLADDWTQCGAVKTLITEKLLYVHFQWG